MTMRVTLSAIGYVHGVPHAVAELDDPAAAELVAPAHGLSQYRVSDLQIAELAIAAAEQSLEHTPRPPDLVVYATDNDRPVGDSLGLITRSLGLPHVNCFAVSGHLCGNLAVALRVAAAAVREGSSERALVVVADAAQRVNRVMRSGLSVFSDGAAACIVSEEASGEASISMHAVATAASADVEPTGTLAATAMLGAAAMAALEKSREVARSDFRYLVFPNYRLSSQRFMASALGFPDDRILWGDVGGLGHAFGADVLVTLDEHGRSGALRHGDRVLATVTGPTSWSLIDFELGGRS
jgi:3-oxoacyl-[acyl-carrier-protein] synthase III